MPSCGSIRCDMERPAGACGGRRWRSVRETQRALHLRRWTVLIRTLGSTDGLQALAEEVRSHGSRLSDEELTPSDAVIPPEDLSLDEARELLSDDGFIPDVLGT